MRSPPAAWSLRRSRWGSPWPCSTSRVPITRPRRRRRCSWWWERSTPTCEAPRCWWRGSCWSPCWVRSCGARKLRHQLPAPRREQPQLLALAVVELLRASLEHRLECGERLARLGREELALQLVEERRVLAQHLVDHRERHPVEPARPQLHERLAVLGGGIALVRGESVAGKLAVELEHHRVARRLGDDGGRGDAEVDAVALVEGVLRHVDAG